MFALCRTSLGLCRYGVNTMNVVHKYGGTSVATVDKIKAVARHIAKCRAGGDNIVVVASAMGSSTDELKRMSELVGGGSSREVDSLLSTGEQQTVALLALALQSLGVPAVSLTGYQCGFVTTAHHSKARIKRIDAGRLREVIDSGAVPVVAGFQGMDEHGNITTLGRGGSDTTAVALAATLGWSCDIYTDVECIHTADPRIVPSAKKVHCITYDEMMELAALGAKVLETRSVELAKKYSVPLFLGKSLESDRAKGTVIMPSTMFEDIPVTGISCAADCATLSAKGPAAQDWVGTLFSVIAGHDISVDTITMQIEGGGERIVSFCCSGESTDRLLREIARSDLPVELTVKRGIARLSLVGAGMIARSGVAARAFSLLTAAGIPYYHITTSEMAISLTVDSADIDRAMNILAEGFGLCGQPGREELGA